jgi:sarcosine oxidase, subunit gamma
MSNAVSALNAATYSGFAEVAELGLCGMISLRADLGSQALLKALQADGLSLPAQRQIATGAQGSVAWMSPDELLILCDYAGAPALAARVAEALKGEHALVTNVSDARAVFRVSGAKADQVVQKLCPVDLVTLKTGEIRRSRAAQVPVALWRSGEGEITLISFRSVAGYVMGLLEVSARKGGEIA